MPTISRHTQPANWPQPVMHNAPGDVPGAPVMYGPAQTPDEIGAGYGYQDAEAKPETDIFYYHSDHLGSTSYITDNEGNATQFVCYMPYGETLVDEHTTAPDPAYLTAYKFNGKEMDAETGLYYYGARYYEPELAMWYGVDALAEKYPNMGGYVYCAGNPVKLVDPDGRKIDPASLTQFNDLRSAINQKIELLQNQLKDCKNKNDIAEIKGRIGALNMANMGLTAMVNDENKNFILVGVPNNPEGFVQQDFSPEDIQNGTYKLMYFEGDIGHQIHEVAIHGGQIANGDIKVDPNTGMSSSNNPGNIEVDAYKAQFAFNGKLNVYVLAPDGSPESFMNNKFITDPAKKLNINKSISSIKQIDLNLINSMTEKAIGEKLMYSNKDAEK